MVSPGMPKASVGTYAEAMPALFALEAPEMAAIRWSSAAFYPGRMRLVERIAQRLLVQRDWNDDRAELATAGK